MDLSFDANNVKVNMVQLQKMAFLFNAVENGWTINKKKNLYIFSKNHEGKKEVHLDSYLARFMKANLDLNSITNN